MTTKTYRVPTLEELFFSLSDYPELEGYTNYSNGWDVLYVRDLDSATTFCSGDAELTFNCLEDALVCIGLSREYDLHVA